MKFSTATFTFLTAIFLLGPWAGTVKADPAAAEDVAYRMATTYIARSFMMAPTDHSGLLGGGQAIRVLIPVSRGLDYVFLVAGDDNVRDLDVYVYDEVGQLILDDRRRQPRAGVQFRSSYNGTAVVYVHMVSANGLGAYCILVGRRGSPPADEQIFDEDVIPAPGSPMN